MGSDIVVLKGYSPLGQHKAFILEEMGVSRFCAKEKFTVHCFTRLLIIIRDVYPCLLFAWPHVG